MNKYERGKIYKLVDNTNGNIYIGSTIQPLSLRKYQHKQNNQCMSKLIIKNGNYDIILIENYPCKSKEELFSRERFHIENNNCINKYIPARTKKELLEYYNKNSKNWYIENKDKKLEYDKKYRKDNKERIAKYFKEYQQKNKDAKSKYKTQLNNYQNSWCGNRRTNYENNLLNISIDIFN
tara:strand:- start:604 stop:1143 length:540 start_codon:yes stop_codon:yes gene_type:complete